MTHPERWFDRCTPEQFVAAQERVTEVLRRPDLAPGDLVRYVLVALEQEGEPYALVRFLTANLARFQDPMERLRELGVMDSLILGEGALRDPADLSAEETYLLETYEGFLAAALEDFLADCQVLAANNWVLDEAEVGEAPNARILVFDGHRYTIDDHEMPLARLNELLNDLGKPSVAYDPHRGLYRYGDYDIQPGDGAAIGQLSTLRCVRTDDDLPAIVVEVMKRNTLDDANKAVWDSVRGGGESLYYLQCGDLIILESAAQADPFAFLLVQHYLRAGYGGRGWLHKVGNGPIGTRVEVHYATDDQDPVRSFIRTTCRSHRKIAAV